MYVFYSTLTMVQLVFASAYKEPKLTPVKVLREELEKRGLSKKGKQQELRARLADAGGLEEDTNNMSDLCMNCHEERTDN
jgi:hypothetical protein